MGAQPEDQPLNEPVTINITDKADYLKNTKELLPHLKKHKAVCCLILLVIILSVVLITVITRSSSCDLNGKESGRIAIIDLPEIGNSTDDRSTTKKQKCAPCEDDWIWYRGNCYYFSTKKDTWDNSQKFCKSHDASLALIDNQQEYDFMFRYKGKDNHWIGLRRTDDNKAWMWTNGTLYTETLFTIKRSSDENIEHVYLNHNGVNSEEGINQFKWICKKM